MIKRDLVLGLNIDGDCTIPECLCAECQLGKFTRLSFIKDPKHQVTRIGELVCADSWGPVSVRSLGDARYFVTFKDDYSGYLDVYFMKKKSETPAYLRIYAAKLLNETGNHILTLRTDNAKGEFVNKVNQAWIEERGIRHETNAPYTPQQNGTAERTNRTLLDSARCMLISSGLPSNFWAEAVAYSVFIRNRVLSKSSEKTPYENWNNRKPDLSDIRIFGSKAYVRIPNPDKLGKRSQEGVFIGRCKTQKAFRVYVPETKKIIISRHVIIDEKVLYSDMNESSDPTPVSDLVLIETNNNDVDMDEDNTQTEAEQPCQPNVINPIDETLQENTTVPDNLNLDANLIPQNDVIIQDEVPEVNNNQPRRSGRTPKYSDRYLEYLQSLNRPTIIHGVPALTHEAEMNQMKEPSTYVEAISCSDSQHWLPAIFEEYDSLIENGTWYLCELPAGRKAIQGKWIFKFKPGHKSTASRFKARFVIKGYSQVFGLDYCDTYAPVAKYYSLRVILAIAAAKDLDMIQLDVKTAFLYGELEEEIYMEQPEGFVVPGKEKQVCRLVKSIYGLKQASRCWNTKFNEFILRFGLSRSSADTCVYFRHQRPGEDDEEFTAFIMYVDDGLAVSSSKTVLDSMLEFLGKEFEIKSLPADRFIGIDINRNRSKRSIHLAQSEYCRRTLARFNMNNCNPLAIPADPGCKLSPEMSPQNEEEKTEMSNTPFLQAIGSLMHLSNLTRPDISYAVGQVSRYSQNPGKQHWKALKRSRLPAQDGRAGT